MQEETQEALILRGIDYREYDRLVSYWTPSQGRLDVVVKGAKRPTAKLAIAAQTLHCVKLQLKQGRGALAQVVHVESIESFEALRQHWLALSAALLLLEVLYSQHEGLQDGAAVLYHSIVQGGLALEKLLKAETPPKALACLTLQVDETFKTRASLLVFLLLQLTLLRALGYLPSWAEESALSHTPLSASMVALPFSVLLGGVLHPHELPQLEQQGQQQILRVSRGTLKVLYYLSQPSLLEESPPHAALFEKQHTWLWDKERLPLAPLLKAQRLLCQVLEQSCHRTFHASRLLQEALNQVELPQKST